MRKDNLFLDSSEPQINWLPVVAILLLVLGLALGSIAPAFAQGQDSNPTLASLAGQPSGQGNQAEVRLIRQMISLNLSEVSLTSICSKLATHADLSKLCDQMRSQHAQQAIQLGSWLRSWYNQVPESGASGIRLVRLARKVGRDKTLIDPALMKELITLQQKAMATSQACASQAARPELVSYCQTLAAGATQHLQALNTYADQWYPGTGIGATP